MGNKCKQSFKVLDTYVAVDTAADFSNPWYPVLVQLEALTPNYNFWGSFFEKTDVRTIRISASGIQARELQWFRWKALPSASFEVAVKNE